MMVFMIGQLECAGLVAIVATIPPGGTDDDDDGDGDGDGGGGWWVVVAAARFSSPKLKNFILHLRTVISAPCTLDDDDE